MVISVSTSFTYLHISHLTQLILMFSVVWSRIPDIKFSCAYRMWPIYVSECLNTLADSPCNLPINALIKNRFCCFFFSVIYFINKFISCLCLCLCLIHNSIFKYQLSYTVNVTIYNFTMLSIQDYRYVIRIYMCGDQFNLQLLLPFPYNLASFLCWIYSRTVNIYMTALSSSHRV